MTTLRYVLLAQLVLVGVVEAQTGPRRFEAGFDMGAFVDYPSQFAERYCEQRAAGVAARGSYWILTFVGVEGAIVRSLGIGGETCYLALQAPPQIGVPFTRGVYSDDVIGTSLFSTQLSALVEPFPLSPVSPRARIGAARLWNKKMSSWHSGAEVRFSFGPHALVLGVERWSMSLDLLRQVVIYQPTGGLEVLSTTVVPEKVAPYLVKMGWAIAIG